MPPSIEKDLMRPEAYPEDPGPIELVQTHISYVFIGRDHVYKVKKPVNFGFLDFSTLEKRRHFSEQEVRLNSRLAPDTYLGVIPIVEKDGRLVLSEGGAPAGGEGASPTGGDVPGALDGDVQGALDGDVPGALDGDVQGALDGDAGAVGGEIVEYAVKMRRIPMELLMKTLLAKGELDDGHLERVAGAIARFHLSAERSAEIDGYGGAMAFKVNTDENFAQTEGAVGRTIERSMWDELKAYTEMFFEDKADVFERRIAEGRIRDCHGDLHMEHVVLTDPVVVFDCIEFNERFRYSDTAADIAFLAMDLDFHGRRDLGEALIGHYIRESGDEGVRDVLDFYKVYRAYVRGKVIGFRLDDPRISEEDKGAAREAAQRYFELAHSYIPK